MKSGEGETPTVRKAFYTIAKEDFARKKRKRERKIERKPLFDSNCLSKKYFDLKGFRLYQ